MAQPFKKPRSILNAFAKAARRVVLGAAIGIGTLLPTSAFAQQKETTLPYLQNIEMVNDTAAKDILVTTAVTDSLYNKAANQFLLEQARQEYADLCKTLPSYSQDIADFQSRLNGMLQKQGAPVVSDVIVLDPYKFDVAYALGFTPRDAVILQLNGREGDFNEEMISAAAYALHQYHHTPYMRETYTSAPMTLSATFNTVSRSALLIPMTDNAPAVTIPGLTRAESVLVVNTHEGWHVLDSRYTFGHINFSNLNRVDMSDFNSVARSPDALEFYSIKSKKETFADVASLGELIRTKGFDTSLIDKVISYRTADPSITHMTVPALKALKSRIEHKGLADFRKMDDKEAQDLYYKLTDRHGTTAGSLRAGIIYEGSSEKGKNYLHIKSIFNRDVKKAIQFKKYFTKDEVFHLDRKKGIDDLSMRTLIELNTWNPLQELQDRAFEAEGKITPASLSRTYLQMQTEFSARMKEEPKNDLYPEKMAALKAAFVNAAEELDYVQINLDRGVTIAPPVKPAAPSVPFLRL